MVALPTYAHLVWLHVSGAAAVAGDAVAETAGRGVDAGADDAGELAATICGVPSVPDPVLAFVVPQAVAPAARQPANAASVAARNRCGIGALSLLVTRVSTVFGVTRAGQ
jgi:hypothetical protein